jgi:tight adherence protein C
MSQDQVMPIAALLVGIVILVGLSASLLWREARQRDLNGLVARALGQDDTLLPPHAWMVGWLRGLGDQFRRFYSPANLEHMRSVILASGYNPQRVLSLLLGGKIVLMIFLPILAVAAALCVDAPPIRFIIIGIGVIVGIVGPEWALSLLRSRFIAKLQRGTPDALDLLVICSEAGMGLESALERVAQEMRPSNAAMSSILTSLLDDLRVLPQRDAFVNLGMRSGIDGLRRVGTMLGQSLRYGTPLSNALRAVAMELRQERANKLEEGAVKLPALLIFPTIFFIMPSLYIVLLGPSFMGLFEALKTVTANIK